MRRDYRSFTLWQACDCCLAILAVGSQWRDPVFDFRELLLAIGDCIDFEALHDGNGAILNSFDFENATCGAK